MTIAKAIYRTVVLVSFVLITTLALAQAESLKPAVILPTELEFAPNPAGYQIAKVVGDSTKPGPYAIRLRFPAGLRIEPHFHPDNRIVSVISGTVYVGYGDRFDETKLKAVPAGGFWTEPAGQPHFALTK